MSKKGFTLIELLVVISIIALLLSILMPSLNKAKQQAKTMMCMSNLKQVTMGSLTYEVDNGRLPIHLWEISRNSNGQSSAIPMQITMGLVNPKFDVRSYYQGYVSVNYFKCPFVPAWQREVDDLSSEYNIYTDYVMSGGYWARAEPGQTWSSIVGSNYDKSKQFTKSSQVWSYGGNKFNVLFADGLWKYLAANQLRTNHPSRETATKFLLEPPNSDRWVSAFYYGIYANTNQAQEFVSKLKANYSFCDGSVVTLQGDDEKMVDVPHRRDGNYSLYLPRR